MPTFIHGKDTAVYIDEFNLSEYFTAAETNINNSVAETTGYGATDASFINGHKSGTLSLSGMWAADTDGSDEELQALLGNATTPVITVRQGTATIGGRAILAQANETSYAISSPVADITTVTADFECSTNNTSNLTFALIPGVQLTTGASVAHGSLGNLSSVDNSASSANGGAATLHVPTNTIGGGNTTLKVQHSANNSTWADLITFTAVGAGTKTSEIKAVSGTVNRYLRATASTAGSSGAITFMIAFSRF